MPKISVALATYNGGTHLREQLASLVGQTVQPTELVVSDDGSTDETLAIIEDFARRSPFPVVRAPHKGRLGFADNFLHAAENCRHELIAFCDQDDVWLPSKLEIASRRIIADDSLIALHTLTVTDADLRPAGFVWMQGITGNKVFEPLELDPFFTGWGNSMIFRRELLGVCDRAKRPKQPFHPDRFLSHDTWLYTLAAALGRVSHILTPLLLYRQHGNNAAGVTIRRKRSFLQDRMSIELDTFREQERLHMAMIPIMEQLSRDPGIFALHANAAARGFKRLSRLNNIRLNIYYGRSLAARNASFRDYNTLLAQHHPGHPSGWFGSRVKSLVLGVGGLRMILPNRGRRITPEYD